jgi:hypothetical protein
MAIVGDTECREIAPCGTGTWGDIPIEADTQFVDANYIGLNDGSQAHPFTTIGQAVAAANQGALIAIAAGTYAEYVVTPNAVRIWGRCPDLVEVVGVEPTQAAFNVWHDESSGVEIHDLAISGGGDAVSVSGARDVLVDRVWIHDTTAEGIYAANDFGATHVTVRRSLIERATNDGAFAGGVAIDIEYSSIRDTRVSAGDPSTGRGVNAQPGNGGERAKLRIASSRIDASTDSGVFVSGSDATIEGTVVHGTLAAANARGIGAGIHVQRSVLNGERASARVVGSYVSDNHAFGVSVANSDADLETVVVRDTQSDDGAGAGISVSAYPYLEERGRLTVRSSFLVANRSMGIAVDGSDATIEGVLIRGTGQKVDVLDSVGIAVANYARLRSVAEIASCVIEAAHNAGIVIVGSDAQIRATAVRDTTALASEDDISSGILIHSPVDTPERSTASIVTSVCERNAMSGIAISASDVTIESTAARDTQPNLLGHYGQGIHVQLGQPSQQGSVVAIRTSAVERSRLGGILALSSDVSIDATKVVDTQAELASDGFGDGLGVLLYYPEHPATMRTHDVLVAGSMRAGLSSFGGAVTLQTTTFECNPISLDAEIAGTSASSFEDAGGNTCGCGGVTEPCTAVSSGLAPPEALAEGP